jgi:hypothetical protein
MTLLLISIRFSVQAQNFPNATCDWRTIGGLDPLDRVNGILYVWPLYLAEEDASNLVNVRYRNAYRYPFDHGPLSFLADYDRSKSGGVRARSHSAAKRRDSVSERTSPRLILRSRGKRGLSLATRDLFTLDRGLRNCDYRPRRGDA